MFPPADIEPEADLSEIQLNQATELSGFCARPSTPTG